MMLCYSSYVIGIFGRKLSQYKCIPAHVCTVNCISIIAYNCMVCKYNNLKNVMLDSFENISLSIVSENVCFSNKFRAFFI